MGSEAASFRFTSEKASAALTAQRSGSALIFVHATAHQAKRADLGIGLMLIRIKALFLVHLLHFMLTSVRTLVKQDKVQFGALELQIVWF